MADSKAATVVSTDAAASDDVLATSLSSKAQTSTAPGTTALQGDSKSDDGLNLKDPERNEADDERQLVNGGVVIRDGNDVARYVVSTQDDGDRACTFRSFIIGSGKTLSRLESTHDDGRLC